MSVTTIKFHPQAEEHHIVDAIDTIYHKNFMLNTWTNDHHKIEFVHDEDDADFILYLIDKANQHAGYKLVEVA